MENAFCGGLHKNFAVASPFVLISPITIVKIKAERKLYMNLLILAVYIILRFTHPFFLISPIKIKNKI